MSLRERDREKKRTYPASQPLAVDVAGDGEQADAQVQERDADEERLGAVLLQQAVRDGRGQEAHERLDEVDGHEGLVGVLGVAVDDVADGGLRRERDGDGVHGDPDQAPGQGQALGGGDAEADEAGRGERYGDGHEDEAELGLVDAAVALRHPHGHGVGHPARDGREDEGADGERHVGEADLGRVEVVGGRGEDADGEDADHQQPAEEGGVDERREEHGGEGDERERLDGRLPERLLREPAPEEAQLAHVGLLGFLGGVLLVVLHPGLAGAARLLRQDLLDRLRLRQGPARLRVCRLHHDEVHGWEHDTVDGRGDTESGGDAKRLDDESRNDLTAASVNAEKGQEVLEQICKGMAYPIRTPVPSMTFHSERRRPLWWTKNRSETVDVTRVSSGAEAIPWKIRIAAREAKDYAS